MKFTLYNRTLLGNKTQQKYFSRPYNYTEVADTQTDIEGLEKVVA